MQRNSIRHRVIDLPGTKIPITEELMASIMKIVLDKENYPILIHCNHGKHRTGCAIAVFRHVSGWSIDSIVDEYQGFAQPKVRTCDITYISNYQVSSLQRLFVKERIYRTRPVLSHDKMVRMLMFSVIVLAIWLTTLICM
jgi:tyrosine-protein phosphatase SIW14